MKIDRLLELTREMYPTEYSDAVLLMWLSQCENSVLTEINLLAVSECTELQQVTDAELSVPHPYDKLYLPYMQAMICQANGETDKYVNHMQIYNTFRDEYARWVCAVIAPAYGEAKKEGYYLSAYALAQERGFAGTVDDWLDSLRGLQGEKGDKGDRGDPGEAVLPVAVGAAGAQAGVHYEAFGEDLPELEIGRQIVLIPMATNVAEEIYLALNDGADHPIRLRAVEADGDTSMPVPVGALLQNVPYTLTFAGDFWLVDSIFGGGNKNDFGRFYEQADEPMDAKDGDWWLDTDENPCSEGDLPSGDFVTRPELKKAVQDALDESVLDLVAKTVEKEVKGITPGQIGALPADTKIPSKTSQLVNDAGFLTAQDLPSEGGENWELIVEQTEPLTNAEKVYITEDSEGNPLKLKEAILCIGMTTKGSAASLQIYLNDSGSYSANLPNTSANRLFRIHIKKDVIDGMWITDGWITTYNASQFSSVASHIAFTGTLTRYGFVKDEFINKICFYHGTGAEYVGYKLYGIRG